MRKRPLFLSTLLALVLLVSACGSPQAATPAASLPTPVPPTVAAPTEAATSAPEATAAATSALPVTGTGATVAMTSSADFGPILVDDKGMTLYLFEKDTPNTSNCYDKCATNWPPLLTSGDPLAGDGVQASMLGTTQRTDGTMQVTYNGWPLYYYAKDKAAGDLLGQGVGDVWWLLAPDGSEVKAAGQPQAAPTTAAPTAVPPTSSYSPAY